MTQLTTIETTARALYNIQPLHSARDADKLDALCLSMDNGWDGRPVLAVQDGDTLYALTGSHRIAAAHKTAVDVDVLAIVGYDFDPEWLIERLLDASDDDDRLTILVSIGAPQDAIDLMQAEVDGND